MLVHELRKFTGRVRSPPTGQLCRPRPSGL